MTGALAASGSLYSQVPHPVAKRKPHVSKYHGEELDDPWSWLKDPNYPKVEDEEILAYLREENDYFSSVMTPHENLRERLFQETKSRHVEEESSVPVRDGEFLYQWRFDKGAEYRTWWRKPVSGDNPWQCILNEPELAKNCEYFRLGGFDASPNGSLLTWSEDTNGSERYKAFLRPTDSGDTRELELPEILGTPIFAMDGDSLVYLVVSEQWRPWQVWVHSLSGTCPDECIYEESDERFRVSVDITRSEKYLLISTGDHTTNECLVVPADAPLTTPRVVSPRKRGCLYSVDHAHNRFYILINDTHENFRLVSTPETAIERGNWREEIAASDSALLQDLDAFERWLVISEMADALDRLRVRDYAGNEHWVEFPESVYSASLGEVPAFDADKLRIEYESMVTPETTFDYLPEARRLVKLKTLEVPGYDASRFETWRLWAEARDGRRIPVSLVSLKGRSSQPSALHLYGYGAYGIGMPPGFSLSRISLLERGFTFAIAHVRGGDELGRGWYLDGKLHKRQNTFNDFVDVARHLVEIGLSKTGRMAISGGSAGGELMGAVLNQAPELWGAVVAHVPFVDVLNTMLDAELPLTPPEWDEWGNPIEDPKAFDLIASYCPYTQTTSKDYPPILVTAGLNDPRVTYWEPAKWVAKLRHLKTDKNILLLKTNMGAGHAGKTGRFERLREIADEQAFILLAMQMPEIA